MDRVRLGRALGYGTRHAAKTVAAIAEAASASSSAPPRADSPGRTSAQPQTQPPIHSQAQTHPHPHPQTQIPAPAADIPSSRPKRVATVSPQRVGHGVRNFKRSFWGPLATFSGALWLRVTGLFFGLIAFAMGDGAWRLRGGIALRSAPAEAHRFWVFLAFTALFGYFAISSFVRATLRERRAAVNSR